MEARHRLMRTLHDETTKLGVHLSSVSQCPQPLGTEPNLKSNKNQKAQLLSSRHLDSADGVAPEQALTRATLTGANERCTHRIAEQHSWSHQLRGVLITASVCKNRRKPRAGSSFVESI